MGLSTRSIVKLNDVSKSTVCRYIKRYQLTRNIKSLSERYGDCRGREGFIRYSHLLLLCQILVEDPTLYLDEIADIMRNRLHQEISDGVLRYWMKKLKISRKKLWKYSREACVAQEFYFWRYIMAAHHHISQFIFIDESHIDSRNVNRPYGWSLCGQRAERIECLY